MIWMDVILGINILIWYGMNDDGMAIMMSYGNPTGDHLLLMNSNNDKYLYLTFRVQIWKRKIKNLTLRNHL